MPAQEASIKCCQSMSNCRFSGAGIFSFVPSSKWEGRDTKLIIGLQSYEARSVCRSLGANKEDLTL